MGIKISELFQVTDLSGGKSITTDATGASKSFFLDSKEDTQNKSQPGGYASLDENGKVPLSQISDAVINQMIYAGTWNASTALATLSENGQTILGITDAQITLTNDTTPVTGYISNQGNYYLTKVAGTFAGFNFEDGDWLVSNASGWDKVDNTDAVQSVQGRTGAVVLTKQDVGLGVVDNTRDIDKPVSTAQQAAINGVSAFKTGSGSNAGTLIKTTVLASQSAMCVGMMIINNYARGQNSFVSLQGYNYPADDRIYNFNATAMGLIGGNISMFIYNGYVHFYLWGGDYGTCAAAIFANGKNVVDTIVGTSMPTTGVSRLITVAALQVTTNSYWG